MLVELVQQFSVAQQGMAGIRRSSLGQSHFSSSSRSWQTRGRGTLLAIVSASAGYGSFHALTNSLGECFVCAGAQQLENREAVWDGTGQEDKATHIFKWKKQPLGMGMYLALESF